MAVTDEAYSQARRLLTDYPAPTKDELAVAAAAEPYYRPASSSTTSGSRCPITSARPARTARSG